jgi:hypothetical protein
MQVTPLPHPAAITTPRFRHRLGHFDMSSTVHLRSTPRISPDAVIAAPFPSTLTTGTLYPSSSWRFEACSCKPASGGPPPSSTKHPTLLYPPFSSNVGSGHTVTPNPSIERTSTGLARFTSLVYVPLRGPSPTHRSSGRLTAPLNSNVRRRKCSQVRRSPRSRKCH